MKPEFKQEFEGILKQLQNNNPALTQLNLSYNEITAADAKRLAAALRNNHTLTTLDLGDNQIGASGAKDISLALKTNQTLTTLFLGSNRIGDPGAKDISLALKTNQTLTTLFLGSNQIGTSGAKDISLALKTNQTLTTLNLWYNQIGDPGAKDISLALKTNHTLRSLNLGGNQIGAQGAKDISLALKDNHTLTTLGLFSYNQIGAEMEKAIQQLLTRNQEAAKRAHEAAKLALLESNTAAVTGPSITPMSKNSAPSPTSAMTVQTWVTQQSMTSMEQSPLLPLDAKQQKTLVKLLTQMPDFATRRDLANVPQRQELSYALSTDAEKFQQTNEQAYLKKQPLLYDYYFTFQRIMNQTFVAALAINSELVKNDKASSQASHANTIAGLITKAITTIAGTLPGLGTATSILSALIEKGLEIHANNQLAQLVSIAPGPAQMEQLIERIARELTLKLEKKLTQLTPKKTFPLLDSLKEFYKNAKKKFVVELAETLQQQQAVEDALQLLKTVMQEDKTFDRSNDFVTESVRYLLNLKQQNASQNNNPIPTTSQQLTTVIQTVERTATSDDSTMQMLIAMQAKMEAMQQAMERKEKEQRETIKELAARLKTREDQQIEIQKELAELRAYTSDLKQLLNFEALEKQLEEQKKNIKQLESEIKHQGDKADKEAVAKIETHLHQLRTLSSKIEERQFSIERAHQEVRSKVNKIPTDWLAGEGEDLITTLDCGAKPTERLQAFRTRTHELEVIVHQLLLTVSEHDERLAHEPSDVRRVRH